MERDNYLEEILFLKEQYKKLQKLYPKYKKTREYIVGIRKDQTKRHISNISVVILVLRASNSSQYKEYYTINKLGNPNLCNINKYEDVSTFEKYIGKLFKNKNYMERTITLTLDKAKSMYGKSKEMDELLLSNFRKEELEKPQLPTSWKELNTISGAYINHKGIISSAVKFPTKLENINVFATEKQAKSTLAMAQLSQLMKVYNGDWEADWNNEEQPKYILYRTRHTLRTGTYYLVYHFLAFKSEKLRDEFLSNFADLINQYFMLY